MKRDYISGEANDASFFVGTEVEKTPAYNMKTLFVVGLHSPDIISNLANEREIKHIYLGANHSFNSSNIMTWEALAKDLLKRGYWVTLDFDLRFITDVGEMLLSEYDQFIPQISVKIPYARLFGYNACVKIDDSDFRASNEGVWVHQLHDLMDRSKFTNWTEYGKDEIIEPK